MRHRSGFGIDRHGYYGYGIPHRSGGGCGCLSGITAIVVVLVALALSVPIGCTRLLSGRKSASSTTSSVAHQTPDISTSYRTREKLAADACIATDTWIDDQAGWLDNHDTVVDAMRSFYEQTGVQPYLVIAESIEGSRDYAAGDAERYLRNRYDELFEDDGHLILLFCEPYENEYDPYLLVGADASQVVDADGENIIYAAIDHWYTDDSLSDDEYFARIFVASANAMMRGTDFSEFG